MEQTQDDIQIEEITNQINYNYIDLTTLLIQNGIFITEKQFLEEDYFIQNRKTDIETYLSDYLESALKNNKFFIINAEFLKNDGGYRKIIHEYVEKNFSDFASFSLGNKNFIIIIKKNKIYEKIVKINREELIGSVDMIYYKMQMKEEEIEKEKEKENKHLNNINLTEEEIKELELEEEDELIKEKIKDIQLKNEQEEKLKLQRKILLPHIQKCEISNIENNSTSVIIKLPKISFDDIFQKNKSIIRGFSKIYENTKIEYLIFLYSKIDNKFLKISESNQNIITLTNLKSNSIQLIKICLKFDKFYSKISQGFMFALPYGEDDKKVKTFYYYFGDNKNNRIFGNISENKINDEFISTPTKLNNSKIKDFSQNDEITILLLNSNEIVTSGKTLISTKNELNLDFEEDKIENVDFYFSAPFIINFKPEIKIRKVSCGFDFSIALGINGHLYSWGMNDSGQLGLNLPFDVVINNPKLIQFTYENLKPNEIFVTDIETGNKHCISQVYLNQKIKLFSWGLGNGYEANFNEKKSEVFNSLFETENNRFVSKIRNGARPNILKFSDCDKIVKIKADFDLSGIIIQNKDNFRTIFTFGSIENFQLGLDLPYYGKDLSFYSIPTEISFFIKNKLSVLDVSFSQINSVFLVRNLEINKNEIYYCGGHSYLRKFTQEEIKNVVRPVIIPVKIYLPFIDEINEGDEPVMISADKRNCLILTRNNKLFLIGKTYLNNSLSTPINSNENNEFSFKEIIGDAEGQFKIHQNEKVIKINLMMDSISILTESI